MNRTWLREWAGPDPDEEEHVESDNTEIVERDAGGEDKGRAK